VTFAIHLEALGSVFFSFKLSSALKSGWVVIGLKDEHSTLFSGVSGVLSLVIENTELKSLLSPLLVPITHQVSKVSSLCWIE
jgi:hypothetical protein